MKAKDYIKKVFEEIKTVDEAKTLYKEVKDWFKVAPESEIAIYRDSGAGEMLLMMCDE